MHHVDSKLYRTPYIMGRFHTMHYQHYKLALNQNNFHRILVRYYCHCQMSGEKMVDHLQTKTMDHLDMCLGRVSILEETWAKLQHKFAAPGTPYNTDNLKVCGLFINHLTSNTQQKRHFTQCKWMKINYMHNLYSFLPLGSWVHGVLRPSVSVCLRPFVHPDIPSTLSHQHIAAERW